MRALYIGALSNAVISSDTAERARNVYTHLYGSIYRSGTRKRELCLFVKWIKVINDLKIRS